ncbi:DUF2141 domain-containing protein [Aquiflexum gelatinilyticum]|uniref:DUF2141 domain-containing protein n=1 Tax=Aquiflexum gelatinilyticum TaxID=2961943 RepID=A0A9X2T0L8_9BACT|nr:DUF2141 domain-containing protein [Aquiflexum gelatinilyticum]MCR9013955.1 DUF2141 domain-containing protein [Aquiflexum gelatinilyticum]MCS4433350.1 DUF2141 domain-containing protein [Aquiflexum gelatinilyticum]
MKLLILFLIMFPFLLVNQNPTTLSLQVTHVKSDQGLVRVLLFKGESGFPDDEAKAFKSASVKIKDGKAVVDFGPVPEGTYALSVFHDSQNTGKLRTNAFGIPRDGYGFSNDAMGMFGPPHFEKAAFKVTAGKNNVSIKLR